MKDYTLDRMVKIAIALNAEKDIDTILDMILEEAMEITGCDGGTVYIRKDDVLLFYKTITRSKSIRLSASAGGINLPPVPLVRSHVCSCAVIDNMMINIPDVYQSEQFDFTGAQKYDALNQYHTGSMLVIPMKDEKGGVIGVLQLINALDAAGEIIPFSKEWEDLIAALTSLAAVSLNNNRLSGAVLELLHSFVRMMVSAIDMRSPYNANHTKSMVAYAERFLKWLEETEQEPVCKEEEKDPFLMSIWLHDIGKLVVPLEVMDKSTRLGSREQEIYSRIDIGILMERIRGLEEPACREEAEAAQKQLAQARDLIREANAAGYLSDDRIECLKGLGQISCLTAQGERIPLLTAEELEAITVQRGTLTAGERKQIEEHVVYTAKMLGEMRFEGEYEKVPTWAGAHHEFLDGSGYPLHKKAEELPWQVRLLTILDIYDALTAEDRPYKPPMPADKAFGILESMRDEGKLDGDLLRLFWESRAWEMHG